MCLEHPPTPYLIPEAYLPVHISCLEVSFWETNDEGRLNSGKDKNSVRISRSPVHHLRRNAEGCNETVGVVRAKVIYHEKG